MYLKLNEEIHKLTNYLTQIINEHHLYIFMQTNILSYFLIRKL